MKVLVKTKDLSCTGWAVEIKLVMNYFSFFVDISFVRLRSGKFGSDIFFDY